jgi:hypothetical protein
MLDMMLWFKRLFEKERLLLCMRLEDMLRVHPHMDRDHVCAQCGERVGIYPSGQQVLKRYRRVKIMCQVCQPNPDSFSLAPGAAEEPSQSHWR